MKGKKVRVVDLVADTFKKLAQSELEKYELVDVEFVKEGKHRYLRVYIDTIDPNEGVSIDDCKIVSQQLNQKLDALDPIEEEYILEVSSPGIERPLKKEEDFIKFAEKLAQIKLYFPINGSKIIEGILKGVQDGEVLIEDERNNEVISIPKDKIAAAKLLFRF
ncbi:MULTISPECIES: ribosome maturation factor RimP [unclassified Fusibacter]|uniref:ribosome maturation factor RimP n=1 Tax=unclassified Fusibacter TaxID=2624464 RepID=UPI001012EF6A|nr:MULTISPECIES: ribosome maturation factor RimP [unclassified Fusibacter]MCK8058799.1 ribosome maturation factor RimP [Fusibacter sp. A2]NPE21873.1 ribosome maturation factor RimP [Fusibacter sp. A1]RXV61445.1 ribosome maturation factor RimP [Fusibacter sp. A1]